MAFSGQVDDAIHVFALHQLVDALKIADVHLDKLVIRLVLNILQIGKIASVGQLVEVDDLILGILVDKQANHMVSDESGTAGDDDRSHRLLKH